MLPDGYACRQRPDMAGKENMEQEACARAMSPTWRPVRKRVLEQHRRQTVGATPSRHLRLSLVACSNRFTTYMLLNRLTG